MCEPLYTVYCTHLLTYMVLYASCLYKKKKNTLQYTVSYNKRSELWPPLRATNNQCLHAYAHHSKAPHVLLHYTSSPVRIIGPHNLQWSQTDTRYSSSPSERHKSWSGSSANVHTISLLPRRALYTCKFSTIIQFNYGGVPLRAWQTTANHRKLPQILNGDIVLKHTRCVVRQTTSLGSSHDVW